MKPAKPLVSIVIPIMDEAECLPKLLAELRIACDPLPYHFEFLFVDDGSSDGTLDILTAERECDPRVCYVALSRNFGHQAALSAGLSRARGSAVISMDGDLQHPPALIPELLAKYEAGYEIVNTTRMATEGISFAKRLLSNAFYKAFNWLASIRVEPGSADFRLFARPVVEVLNEMPEVRKFLRGLVPWIGFRQTSVPFSAPPRHAGRSKYGWIKSLRLAIDGMTAFSMNPLRKMALGGIFVAALSFLYGFAAIVAHFFTELTVPGWTSLLVSVLFLGGCQLVCFGVLGEYIGRILEQVKGRPVYIIRATAGLESTLQVRPAELSPEIRQAS